MGVTQDLGSSKREQRGLLLLFSLSIMSHSFTARWTVARQAPLSMGFPRQEYRSGLPFPSLGIFPTQGSNSYLLHWQADSLPLSYLGNRTKEVGLSESLGKVRSSRDIQGKRSQGWNSPC